MPEAIVRSAFLVTKSACGRLVLDRAVPRTRAHPGLARVHRPDVLQGEHRAALARAIRILRHDARAARPRHRVRELLAARVMCSRRICIENDDVILTVSSQPWQLQRRGRDIVLFGRGDATVTSAADTGTYSLPLGGRHFGLRVPFALMSPLVTGIEDAFGRRIPADTPALQLLIHYLGGIRNIAGPDTHVLQQRAATHVHDLLALAIGATKDAADRRPARRPARRAARRRQGRYRRNARPGGAVARDARYALPLHAALHSAAVRSRGHDVFRVPDDAAPRPRAPPAHRSPLCRSEDQLRGVRFRLRRPVLLPPQLPPPLRRIAGGRARRDGTARRHRRCGDALRRRNRHGIGSHRSGFRGVTARAASPSCVPVPRSRRGSSRAASRR